MLEYDEKRNYIRMEANCKMTYKFAGSDETHNAICSNLSGAGILFMSGTDITLGKALEICVTPANKVTPPLTAFIEVIRSTIQGNQYEIAASIKGIKGN